MKRSSLFKASRGFTLVELVAVILVLGIVSAVAIPRFVDVQVFQSRGFYDEMLSSLRYAQKVAVASGCDVQATITTGSYSLTQRTGCDAGTFTLAVPHPTGSGNFAVSAPTGVTISQAVAFTFDPWGRASQAVNITVAGRNLSVVAETGYVYEP